MFGFRSRAERRRERALALAIEVASTRPHMATAEIMTLAFTLDGWMAKRLLPDFVVSGMTPEARLVRTPRPSKKQAA